MDLKTEFERYGFEKICDHIYQDPEKNVPKVMKFVDTMSHGTFSKYRQLVWKAIEDPHSTYHGYINHIIKDVDPEIAKHIAANIVVNAGFNGTKVRDELKRKYYYPVPWMMRIKYEDLLTAETYISDGEKFAIYLYCIEDIETNEDLEAFKQLTKSHPDSVFMLFTDGHLLSPELMRHVIRHRNIIFVLTDDDEQSIAFLKQYKAAFGIKCDHHSDALFNHYVEEGVYFIWVRSDSKEFFEFLKHYRLTKSLFIIDEKYDIDLLDDPHDDIETLIKNGRVDFMRKRGLENVESTSDEAESALS
jgi:hypothetical protein